MSKQTRLVEALDAYFNKNKAALKPGTSMSWKRFRQRFSRFYPNLVSEPWGAKGAHIPYVNAYNSINRVLARYGLYMKSSDYYSTFTIIEKDAVAERTKAYITRAKTLQKRAATLLTGMHKNDSEITSLSPAEIQEISKSISAPCISRLSY